MNVPSAFSVFCQRQALTAGILSALAGPALSDMPVAAPASAPASAVVPAAASASAAASTPAAASAPAAPLSKAAKAALANYRGRFASACQKLDDGLYYIDSMELKPAMGSTVPAQYRKALYAAPRCSAASLIVTLNMPPATWTIDGQATASGKLAERITVTGKAGLLTATIAQPAKVQELPDRYTIRFGQEGEIPIGRAVDGTQDKELRRIDKGRLYQSQAKPVGADGYPTDLDLDTYYTRR